MDEEELERQQAQEQAALRQLAEQLASTYAQMPYFPAQIFQAEHHFTVQITLETGAFFVDEMAELQLYGNGYCWESIVEHLMAAQAPPLRAKVDFDAEAEVCILLCPDEKTMYEAAEFIHHRLGGRAAFKAAVATLDPSRLDC
ncbi:MAG: Imm51 family immunity protein [Bacteroidota bacterium]